MKIRPLNDWVVLQEAEPETKTSSGIIIPDVAKEKPQWGTVVAAGPGAYRDEKGKGKDKEKKFIPTEVKPGDRVLFEKYMAKEFETAGQKIAMVREEYILGILGSGQDKETALQKKGPSELQEKGPTAVENTKKKETARSKSKK